MGLGLELKPGGVKIRWDLFERKKGLGSYKDTRSFFFFFFLWDELIELLRKKRGVKIDG